MSYAPLSFLALLVVTLAIAGLGMTFPVNEPPAEGNGFYFGEPLPGLSPSELVDYQEGFSRFVKLWPTVAGSRLNARSCATCHRIPLPGGSGTTNDTFVFHAKHYRDVRGGTVLPRFTVNPAGVLEKFVEVNSEPHIVSKRKAQPLFGLGLLEAVDNSTLIRRFQGEKQSRGRLPCSVHGCGRLGWKSADRNIDEFVEKAFAVELGLQVSVDGSTPLSRDDVRLVGKFIRLLAAPPYQDADQNFEGYTIFKDCGCASCHKPALLTGSSAIEALAKRQIAPYTDLLLHNMGKVLEDVPEGSASAAEFRTPPLWGLRFTGPPYLHDGRAKSLDAAIEQHDGEAHASSLRFRRLAPQQRQALINFLQSL